MKKYVAAFSAALAVTAMSMGPAVAEYPEKPVEFVIPWPPGDLEDVLTRMIAKKFEEMYGSPAGVLNKPGGGGGPFPGAISVATAPADGYTIGSFVIGVPVVGPNIGIPELSPNPFEPVGIFLTYPFVVASLKTQPYSDWASLAEHAKSNKVTLGHFGAPTIPTRVTKALAKGAGFTFGSDAGFDNLDCNTLASGDADVINTTLQLVLPCLDKLNVLTSFTEQRITLTPDTPTQSEINPVITVGNWNGLFVRKEVPQDVRDKIAKAAMAALDTPEAKKIAETTGAHIYWKDAAESQAVIDADIKALAVVNKMIE